MALTDFFTFQKAVDPKMELTAHRFSYYFKQRFNKERVKLTAPEPLKDKDSPLITFSIMINPELLSQLNSDLPDSGKEQYVDGYMKISGDDSVKKIKLRYRGDNNYHWLYDKKSLRIKLSNDVFNMEKNFNLINPAMITSFRDVINYQTTRDQNIISPDCYPVRVKINGKYMGVYLYLSQVDESLLRKYKRMPGSIYNGDPSNQHTLNYFKGKHLWNYEKNWFKKSSRNAEQKKNREDIAFFISSVDKLEGKDFVDFVETYLNKSAFLSFIAVDRLFGSHHHDYQHNHKIYFDPYTGKFEPISWDLRFWLLEPQKDLSLYPLQLKLASNPIYDAQIDKIVYQLIQSGIYNKVLSDYDKLVDTMLPDLKSDVYRDGAIVRKEISLLAVSEPYRIEQFFKRMKHDKHIFKKRIDYLKKLYETVILNYQIEKMSDLEYKLTFSIGANNPVIADFSKLKQSTAYQIINDQQQLIKKTVILYPGKKIVPDTQTLLPTQGWGTDTVQDYQQQYEVILKLDASSEQSIKEQFAKIGFFNYLTDTAVIPVSESLKSEQNLTPNSWYPEREIQQKIFSGVVEIKQNQEFDKYTSVLIKPGTTFIMSPAKSLYFYGQVIAKGTAEQPIRFIAQDPEQPWGIVVVQGQSASGSIFEYCQFSNGSVATKNLIHYTAPFNLHDMDWFEVRHCTIGKNFHGDDAMHIAYAKGLIEHNEFTNARSDALDIDISEVIVNHNVFYQSGNDGLDIMTTQLKSSDNLFIKNGDKGISIGEWSSAEVHSSYFDKNYVGIEIKDKSTLKASRLIIANSQKKAINLYNKNKRYGEGGFLTAQDVLLIGNNPENKQISADNKSTIEYLEEVEISNTVSKNWYKKLLKKEHEFKTETNRY